MSQANNLDITGTIFDLDTFAVHDGPGIRMAVYLKGCPLTCAWCHSPESQARQPELVFVQDRCVRCGACAAVCQRNVHAVSPDGHDLVWSHCAACGSCTMACLAGALSIKGYTVSAREVIQRAERLLPFFRYSGGGVTLTGGEVTMQPEFARAILRGCQELGIHTAIETCGAASWEALERVAEYADLVLYDVKLMDEAAHKRWTGATNARILDNARRLAGRSMVVRVPLIPGISDSAENLAALFEFAAAAGLGRVALLPYNPSAGAKYEWLGRGYELEGQAQDEQQLAELAELGRSAGLQVTIG